ncbi:hypothetical protein ABPG72_019853 [Tetrahymena utriculariae]
MNTQNSQNANIYLKTEQARENLKTSQSKRFGQNSPSKNAMNMANTSKQLQSFDNTENNQNTSQLQSEQTREYLKTSQSKKLRIVQNSPSKNAMNKTSSNKFFSSHATLPMTKSIIDIPFKDPTFKPLLPSRYNVNEKVKPITYVSKEVLVDLEGKVEQLEIAKIDEKQKIKEFKNLQPCAFRVKQPQQFKNKPLRRQESDFQMFKEIFVAPKEKKLEDLKEKEKDFENLFHHDRAKQYEKILHIYNEENEKMKTNAKFLDNQQITNIQKYMGKTLTGANASLKEDILVKTNSKFNFSPRKEAEKLLTENIQVIESTLQLDTTHPKDEYFFDQQIQVQPPDLPNATIASPLTPGNGYAPSVPLTHNFKDSKSNIKDLLVRAKAGMQAGDIQKEAHLSFYLGMVYESNKQYNEAIKFYKQFFTCAKMMEDKIGLALGANRIAVNYFNIGNYEKSIEYHEQNIQLSDLENSYAGFYNIGIAFRKIDHLAESIVNFKKALDWAKQREEVESKCLAHGQLGVSYFKSHQYEEALDSFTSCRELSMKIGNKKLQLDCLLHITQITSKMPIRNSDNAIQVLRDAIECATLLEDRKTAALSMCNLGIMEGNRQYEQLVESPCFVEDIEDFDEEDDLQTYNFCVRLQEEVDQKQLQEQQQKQQQNPESNNIVNN